MKGEVKEMTWCDCWR